MDANGAEHDSLGRFTGKRKKDLQRGGNDGKVKATDKQKEAIRKALVGTKTSCGALITGVSDHACDRIVGREIPPKQVIEALQKSKPYKRQEPC